jgi:diketogulonate reductase-like aldo/keto reductase
MQQHSFGSTGRTVPSVGQGTWNIELRRPAAVKALQRGLDLGMRHIDTAELYGDGAAETIVGEAIRGCRDEVFLVSKVLPGNASRQGVLTACDKSLQRLGTDRLDCYLLHWRGRYPLEDTFAAFEELLQAGKILAFGVSNFDVDDLDEALALVGPGLLACNQVLYHLQQRAIEHVVLPWCEQHGVAVVAYSPFGHNDFPKAAGKGGKVLAEIGAAHAASPRQVALAFLARKPALFTIPKAVDLAHVEENAHSGSLVLSGAEMERIDAAFPLGRKPVALPTI